MLKIYIVETVRPYEGSWIEKIFSTYEEADNFINEGINKFNDELVIKEQEVYSSFNDIYINMGDDNLVFFDIVITNKTIDIIYNMDAFFKWLETNSDLVKPKGSYLEISRKLPTKIDELTEIRLRYERRKNTRRVIQDLEMFANRLGLIFSKEK